MLDDDERHPAIDAAHQLATDLLEPHAAGVDTNRVPRSHLAALGAAGLLGELPRLTARRVSEILAGACLSTWLAWSNHRGLLRELVAAGITAPDGAPSAAALDPRHDPTGPLARLAVGMAEGAVVAGVANAHLRAWPRRAVTAVPLDGGWQLDGTAPWFSGWGLTDIALVGGITTDGRVVLCVVQPCEQPGLRASAPMALAAVQSTQTVRLELSGLTVPDNRVIAITPISNWLRDDRRTTVNANPAVFGLAGSALRLLEQHGERTGESAAVKAAARLGKRLSRVRARCYKLLDGVPADDHTTERLALRSAAHKLLTEATSALVIAHGGGGLGLGSAAQRKVREAMFLMVQGQTEQSRSAALSFWGR